MNTQSLKETIRTGLPALLREDPELRGFIQDLLRGQFADRLGNEDRFEKLLEELRRDREASEQKWAASEQRWAANERKWTGNDQKLDVQQQQLQTQQEQLQVQQHQWGWT